MVPSEFLLILNIHFFPIGITLGGRSTMVQVWLDSKAEISACIASTQQGYWLASAYEEGLFRESREREKAL